MLNKKLVFNDVSITAKLNLFCSIDDYSISDEPYINANRKFLQQQRQMTNDNNKYAISSYNTHRTQKNREKENEIRDSDLAN